MKFIQDPNIHSKQIGSGIVILEENKLYVRELNSTASMIWKMLKIPQSLETITVCLSREFGVDKNDARKDTAKFLDEYQGAKLIQSIPD